MSDVTAILGRIEDGDPSAAEQLLPLVYEELRKLAAAKLAGETVADEPRQSFPVQLTALHAVLVVSNHQEPLRATGDPNVRRLMKQRDLR